MDAVERIKASVGKIEAGGEIVGLMKKHVGFAGVQEAACGAIDNLCRIKCEMGAVNSDPIFKVVALGGIGAVVAGMRAHAGATGVQQQGCLALGVLCANHAQHELGVIEAVLAGMDAHKDAAGVQEQGCAALRSISRLKANKVRVAELGGIEVVLAGMHAHTGAEGVQEQGCGALGILCDNDDVVERIKALGTVREVVERARAAHPSNSSLQAWGEKILGKLE